MQQPPTWKCPEGCPYQSNNAWAVVKVSSYLVAIAVTIAVTFGGDELPLETRGLLIAVGYSVTGTAFDTKGFVKELAAGAVRALKK